MDQQSAQGGVVVRIVEILIEHVEHGRDAVLAVQDDDVAFLDNVPLTYTACLHQVGR